MPNKQHTYQLETLILVIEPYLNTPTEELMLPRVPYSNTKILLLIKHITILTGAIEALPFEEMTSLSDTMIKAIRLQIRTFGLMEELKDIYSIPIGTITPQRTLRLIQRLPKQNQQEFNNMLSVMDKLSKARQISLLSTGTDNNIKYH